MDSAQFEAAVAEAKLPGAAAMLVDSDGTLFSHATGKASTATGAEMTVDTPCQITVDSTIAKRDAHLKSPDYLETETFAKATVNVSDVKKDGDAYVAKAKVDAHGKQAEWDVKFEVVEATDDSVRIKGVHSFDRTVFAIGKPAAEGDSASDEVEATFEVTLQKA